MTGVLKIDTTPDAREAEEPYMQLWQPVEGPYQAGICGMCGGRERSNQIEARES